MTKIDKKDYDKKYFQSHKNEKRLYQIKLNKRKPWISHLYDARKRCNNPKRAYYYCYGGRGIKCIITPDEIKELWFRDKAYNMNCPSIDRKDNDGNYTLENCEFIEMKENSCKNKRIAILQFDKQSNFIKKWNSSSDASKILKIERTGISQVLNKKRKYAGGFIWKYKYQG